MIAAKVANALALDYPRERLEVIVASDGSDRPHRRARPQRRRRPRPRPAARRQDGGAERRGRAGRRRDRSPSPTRTAIWEPDALRAPGRRLRRPRVGYACGQVRFADADGRQPGGRLLALRDGGPRARVAARPGSPPATAAIYAVRREAYRRLTPDRAATTSRFPFVLRQARLARRLRAGGAGEERMVPTIEGEFARKRRMMGGLLGRCWSATGCSRRAATGRSTRSRSSRHRLLRYAAPLLHLRRARRQPRAARRGRDLRRSTLAAQLALLAPPRSAGAIPLRPLRRRPLLRARHRLDRARPLGPPARAARRRPGRRRRGRGERRWAGADRRCARVSGACRRRRARRLARRRRAGARLLAAIAIRLDSRGPVLYRQRRVGRDGEEFELLKLRTMPPAATRSGSAPPVLEDDPRVTARRRVPAALLARRAAEPGQRAPRRDGDRRAAPDDRRPGRRLHRRTSAAASRSARASPAGRRSTAAPGSPGRSGSSSTSGTSSTARPRARPADPRHAPSRLLAQRPGARRVTLRSEPMAASSDRSRLRRSSARTTRRPCTAGSTPRGDRRPGRQPRRRSARTPRGWVERAMRRPARTASGRSRSTASTSRSASPPSTASSASRPRARRCWSASRRPGARASAARPSAWPCSRRPSRSSAPTGSTPDPGHQRGGEEGRHLPRLEARGRDAEHDPPRRRARSTIEVWGLLPRRPAGPSGGSATRHG